METKEENRVAEKLNNGINFIGGNCKIRSFGGEGGTLFEMNTIKSISLRAGRYVDQINIDGVKHGGDGGASKGTLVLGDDEYINEVSIRSGSYIDYIKFTTNKGQFIEGGGNGGKPATIYGRLIAIDGRSGAYVDKLNLLISNV